MPKQIINHGVIDTSKRPEDYQAGAFTFISYEVRNPSGDWRPYLPIKEQQFGKEDSMSCVSFSAISSIEIQEKFITGQETNYSDRWIAKMSDTTPQGNWLYKVGDAIRHYGLVKETDYPAPWQYTWNQYHSPIPEQKFIELKSKGREWLNRWDVKTEFVTPTKAEMIKHLKHAPLQIVIPGHAIVNFLCEEDVVNYFDTYQPYEKKTPYNNVEAVYKYVLTPMEPVKRFFIDDGGKIGVVVMQGFNISGGFAKSPQALEQLKQAFSFEGNEPTYHLPQ